MEIGTVLMMCIPLGIALWVLRAINRYIASWISSKKYKTFADCLDSWLMWSWLLPRKMKRYGIKCWWTGILLMLVSPIALFGYSAISSIYEGSVPPTIPEEKAPFKTHADLVALTGLEDFPSFSYTSGETQEGFWDDIDYFYYTFTKPLSDEYLEKLKARCADADNVFWKSDGDTCFVMQRAWDGKYVKSPVKAVEQVKRLTLSIIDREGFIIERYYGYFSVEGEWADRKTISKSTGVTFPEFSVVNVAPSWGPSNLGTYDLKLASKPSAGFIREIKASSKWKEQNDSTYICEYKAEQGLCTTITVNKNSRIVVVDVTEI